MKKILNRVARITTYCVATGIIIVAIGSITSHLLSPVVAKHQVDIEKWASDLLAMPVKINHVGMSWYKLQPVINLEGVTILNKESNKPALQIVKIRLLFSIPKSLWHMQPVLGGILISGSDVEIHQTETGEFNVKGFPALSDQNQPLQSETRINDIIGWLSQQPRITLRDVNVHYVGASGSKRSVTFNKLRTTNSSSNHVVVGSGFLIDKVPTSFTAAVDWKGNPHDLNSISAKIYVYVAGVTLPEWLNQYGLEYKQWQVKKGIGSAKIWADYNHNTIQKLQTTVQLYDLNLYSTFNKTTHVVNRLSGNFGYRKEGQKIVVAGDEILIDLPNHLWPMTSFNVEVEQQADGSIRPLSARLGYADTYDLQTVLFSTERFLPDTVYKMLQQLKIAGSIQNVSILFPSTDWQNWHQLTFQGDIVQATILPWNDYPGVTNLTTTLNWDKNAGSIIFKKHSLSTFTYDSVFAKPVPIDELVGEIKVSLDDQNQWHFNTNELQLTNNDLAATIKAKLDIDADANAVIDLTGKFSLSNVKRINLYLPIKTFSKNLVTWMHNAFKGNGEVTSGEIVLRGKLADFPFDNQNGSFRIAGDVKNVDLHYADNWPDLKSINGKLVFVGRRMDVMVNDAEILDIPLKNVTANLANMGGDEPDILEISSDVISTEFEKGVNFIRKSPLKNSIGKMFNDVTLSGPMVLKLGLKVPLDNPDKTNVMGNIKLADTLLDMTPWGLSVQHLNGQVDFTEKSATANDITGKFFDKPITINLATDNNIIQVLFKNNIAVKDLESWLNTSLQKVAQGETNVVGTIKLDPKSPLTINLKSDLVGMGLALPSGFGKKPEDTKNLNSNIIIEANKPIKIALQYGDGVGAALLLNKQKQVYKVQAANILIGNGMPSFPPGPGLYVTGQFDTLDWQTIKKYYTQASSSNGELDTTLPLKGVNIHANKLVLGSTAFKDISLTLNKGPNNWLIDVSSPDVAGKVSIPNELDAKGVISADFNKFNVRSQDSSGGNIAIDTNSLPSIYVDANNVSYNDLAIGHVLFDAQSGFNGMTIKSLNIVSSHMSLQSSGIWNSNSTQLSGNATSSNVSALLTSFGMNARNYIISDGKLSFDLNWQGPPFAPTIAGLNGSARLDVGHGRIIDVGASNNAKMDIGRMLNIFSLQNLPRRLTFDFSDLYEKGYSFDYIRGDFNLKNGDILTNNLEINGSIIGVDIRGRISMPRRSYDLTLSITPHDLTSSLPVAATFLVNPVVGLAALGVSTVLSPSVSRAAAVHYSVTGPWSNPAWRQIRGQ